MNALFQPQDPAMAPARHIMRGQAIRPIIYNKESYPITRPGTKCISLWTRSRITGQRFPVNDYRI